MISATILLAATLAAPVAVTVPPRVQTIKVPNNQIPTEIAPHAGALWFVSWHNWPKLEPYLGRITTEGTIRLHQILDGSMPGLTAQAPDGTLWLSDSRRRGLWHVMQNGRTLRVKIDRKTVSIASGSAGTLWCTHPEGSAISSYNVDGSLRGRWEVPRRNGIAPRPNWLTEGPDGALWFTDPATTTVGRITAAGSIKVFPLPRGWRNPGEIVARPDGLWFAVGSHPFLGRITPKGKVSSVAIHAPARAVAAGPDGRMWYSDGAAGIGWVEPDGTTDYVLVTDKPSSVRSITAGPDGGIWFVDEKARTIGRVEPPQR